MVDLFYRPQLHKSLSALERSRFRVAFHLCIYTFICHKAAPPTDVRRAVANIHTYTHTNNRANTYINKRVVLFYNVYIFIFGVEYLYIDILYSVRARSRDLLQNEYNINLFARVYLDGTRGTYVRIYREFSHIFCGTGANYFNGTVPYV